MIDKSVIRENYSGVVKLRLRVGDLEYRLSRTGPNYIGFRDPVELPPCEGVVIMNIDDREHRWSVRLTGGSFDSSDMVEAIRLNGAEAN